ncbi:hypothetical protein HDK77DRAFT_258507 [Phyllosticta capitalensis]|uniref:Uncharacterized protein n=1 Tax=Phyllosticta capitalensis TaxID=121624 RepID=A0ABR1YKZ2_9PEZI
MKESNIRVTISPPSRLDHRLRCLRRSSVVIRVSKRPNIPSPELVILSEPFFLHAPSAGIAKICLSRKPAAQPRRFVSRCFKNFGTPCKAGDLVRPKKDPNNKQVEAKTTEQKKHRLPKQQPIQPMLAVTEVRTRRRPAQHRSHKPTCLAEICLMPRPEKVVVWVDGNISQRSGLSAFRLILSHLAGLASGWLAGWPLLRFE